MTISLFSFLFVVLCGYSHKNQRGLEMKIILSIENDEEPLSPLSAIPLQMQTLIDQKETEAPGAKNTWLKFREPRFMCALLPMETGNKGQYGRDTTIHNFFGFLEGPSQSDESQSFISDQSSAELLSSNKLAWPWEFQFMEVTSLFVLPTSFLYHHEP
jgi:hypothetical protein